jgi:hypothetical protein
VKTLNSTLKTSTRTSVSTLCEGSEDSPPANTVLYHLRTKFEPQRFERVANTLLLRDILKLLPEQVEVAADLHRDPTTVTKTIRTASVTYKRSVERLYSTLTLLLHTRVENKRHTLAVRHLEDGDTASSVLAELLASLMALTLGSRPSSLIVYSTTASVSRFHRCITTPTLSRSLSGARRFSKNSRKDGAESSNTV